ncbi:MAG: CoA-binding protein, partial [Deltaproteobacteria bacterium]|nr:CoA-binding protein [Deltaproteobacteria bacterium]
MNLETLLSPESIALVGASNREGSLGYDMVKMIRKGAYPGEIYPINPKYEEILGIKCYPDLQSIGNPVAINDDTIMALDA